MVNPNQIVAVVDDDESVCRAIKRLLHSAGIEAETFSSGDELLNTLSAIPSYRPACVILDIQMPGTGGLEVQRQLAPLGLPIIMITAHDELAVRQAALASGAAAYLRKPFNAAILLKAVELAINGPLRP
ncbi:response regulator receiver domain-containing protein [Paraburkholderia sp. RAU2J]|uniref:response regulator transcription factor n=1 Tax=Paraburkholderia sp. RAU2J TaxID=1938810 RepID=UPI000EB4E5C9|nr:response regulator [Paraburkholderia sp. RAU2J]RKT21353.1 response regulator receiver domain-containing protein [Paraburkholderia sp. RAU2J]